MHVALSLYAILVQAYVLTAYSWNFYTDDPNSCNPSDSLHLNTSETLTVTAIAQSVTVAEHCNLTLTVADESANGVLIEISQPPACDEKISITGFCESNKECYQAEIACQLQNGSELFWAKVQLVEMNYHCPKNLSDSKPFILKISPTYDLPTPQKGVVKTIAKWVIGVIVVGVLLVLLCVIGIPLCICLKLKKSSSNHQPAPAVVYQYPQHHGYPMQPSPYGQPMHYGPPPRY